MPMLGATAARFILFLALISCGAVTVCAQDSGFDLSMHAHSKATAADIGLPAYPGATPYKDSDNDSAVDMGLSMGGSQFRLMAANYVTPDSPDKVLAFYRKPLSRYGEVLECNNGKPVGKLTKTSSGLTCSDEQNGRLEVNGHDDSQGHELRAGTPQQYRVVGIDKAEAKSTRFGLVYLQVPKDNGSTANSK